MAPLETAAAVDDSSTGDTFTLIKQQIELDFSFAPRRVKGRTALDIQPDQAKLREVVLNCRQLKPTSIKVEGERAAFSYSNLHERLTLNPVLGMEQYHFAKERIARHVVDKDDELVIYMPEKVKIRAVKPSEAGVADDAQGTSYTSLKLEIEYDLDDFRDALHFVGVEDGDARFPHAYTRNSPFAGTASCLFPCIDDGETRSLFEVSIRYPRTLGDALSKPSLPGTNATTAANGVEKADSVMLDADDDGRDLSEEEKAMEMSVICSGTLTDDVSTPFNLMCLCLLTFPRSLMLPTPPAKPQVSAATLRFFLSILGSSSVPSNTLTSPNTATLLTTSDWARMPSKSTPSVSLARKTRCAIAP